ncbi:B3 domain-containing protein Os01g0723500 isoform X1 [Rosa chinensis]|uniref:B3 domain-containing protein Os01g0723500 isoform X1 n=1 Tax=Rosa chinensis TaxID=74649 RepID=UPI000D094C88|nr:B3 domain-containing protein Os01g0723500 isoform X1 [Rosa chinensis]
MVKISRNGVEEKKPSFFKVILPGYSTEHLRFPPRFLRKHIVNKLSKRATLKLKRSPEWSWKVEVRKSGGDVYLKDGWQEFLRDACLGDKEFLVFIYNGKMRFSIKVYDKNGCERMDFPDINTHQHTTSSRSTKRPVRRPRKSSTGNSADKLKEVKEEEVDCNNTTDKCASKSTETLRGRPTKTTEEYTKRRLGRPTKPTSKSTKRPPVRATKKTTESTKRPPVTPAKTTFESTKRPRGRPRKYPVTCKDSAAGKHIPNSEFDVLREVKEEEEDYQESGELFKSKLQYFTCKINRLSQVYMPKPFYGENLSSGNYEVIYLKNSEGTKWYKVKLSRYHNTVFMTKGWGAFAVANQVKVGSLCQFQFLKENRIVVHILNN